MLETRFFLFCIEKSRRSPAYHAITWNLLKLNLFELCQRIRKISLPHMHNSPELAAMQLFLLHGWTSEPLTAAPRGAARGLLVQKTSNLTRVCENREWITWNILMKCCLSGARVCKTCRSQKSLQKKGISHYLHLQIAASIQPRRAIRRFSKIKEPREGIPSGSVSGHATHVLLEKKGP